MKPRCADDVEKNTRKDFVSGRNFLSNVLEKLIDFSGDKINKKLAKKLDFSTEILVCFLFFFTADLHILPRREQNEQVSVAPPKRGIGPFFCFAPQPQTTIAKSFSLAFSSLPVAKCHLVSLDDCIDVSAVDLLPSRNKTFLSFRLGRSTFFCFVR